MTLEVDGEVQALGADDSCLITFAEPGSHDVVVTYRNGWHTVGFNSFFGKRKWTTPEEAAAVVASQELIDPSTYLVNISIYESSDTYNDATVVVDDSIDDSPFDSVFLVLRSYDSVVWRVENHSNAAISGILFGSYQPATSLDASSLEESGGQVPVFAIKRLNKEKIDTITGGITPSRVYDDYDVSYVVVQAP